MTHSIKKDKTKPYLLKKSDIDAFEATHKAHFLDPEAQRLNKSLGDLTGLTHIGFHIVELEPQRYSTVFHKHYNEEECVYILSGNGTAHIGDESYDIAAGDFVGYRSGGLAHSIQNTSKEVLKFIVVGERRDSDIADYPKLNKRLFRQKELPWQLVDIKNIENIHGAGGK